MTDIRSMQSFDCMDLMENAAICKRVHVHGTGIRREMTVEKFIKYLLIIDEKTQVNKK